MTLFIDLDGVLADMDSAYEALTGIRLDKLIDNVDWAAVAAEPDFYANLSPMPDMEALWAYASTWPDVVVLTGVPKAVPASTADKRAWVTKHLGAHVRMIACASKDKSRYAKAGDILVDDWTRYRSHWLKIGGIWITHTSAASSIAALKELAWATL
jgi:5'(3')-deoxyribonucleotidase